MERFVPIIIRVFTSGLKWTFEDKDGNEEENVVCSDGRGVGT